TEPDKMHKLISEKLDYAIEKIRGIQLKAREKEARYAEMGEWPVILLRTPKGWTGPKEFDGKKIEGSFRSHQIPLPVTQYNTKDIKTLENWLKSYRPEELFTTEGALKEELLEITPDENKLMALNPATNGGQNINNLKLPDWKNYTFKINQPGKKDAQDMIEFGKFARDIIKENPKNFRVFGPDETASNRLQKIFEATDRQWLESVDSEADEFVSPSGRVIDSQ